MKGVVSKSTGSWYKVYINGAEVDARLRGKIRTQNLKSTNPVTVGDVVFLDYQNEEYLIKGVEERKNCIVRKSNKLSKQYQLIASNIDQAILVVTPGYPYTPMGFIDRYLITASAYQIPVCILINKKDLNEGKLPAYRRELLSVYQGLGYDCRPMSFFDQEDIEQVKALVKGKTTLISGNSGVGKSTLANALDPSIGQKIGDISTSYDKGQHTTTFAQMFVLGPQSFIIDTPGLKDFGLVHIDKQQLSHYFPEMKAVLNQCKFNNCLHLEEPECAVIDALEKGQIFESRYLNYLNMMDELDQA